jgi:excisionase family DNA binding protein
MTLGKESTRSAPDDDLFQHLLGPIADLVVGRLIERPEASTNATTGDWMDAREAATYLGIHRDPLRKLAAERAIPVHQDGPVCKLYFRRDELNDGRRSGRTASSPLRAVP